MAYDGMKTGVLRVKVSHAENVPLEYRNRPLCCKVVFDDSEGASHVGLPDENNIISWDAAFNFELENTDDTGLLIEVVDEEDTLLGAADTDISDVLVLGSSNQMVEIEEMGRMVVALSFSFVETPANIPDNLGIKFYGAQSLNGRPDMSPFCDVHLKDDALFGRIQPAVGAGPNCVWKQVLKGPYDGSQLMRILCYDYQDGVAQYIGEAQMDLWQIINDPTKKVKSGTLALASEADPRHVQGIINLQVQFWNNGTATGHSLPSKVSSFAMSDFDEDENDDDDPEAEGYMSPVSPGKLTDDSPQADRSGGRTGSSPSARPSTPSPKGRTGSPELADATAYNAIVDPTPTAAALPPLNLQQGALGLPKKTGGSNESQQLREQVLDLRNHAGALARRARALAEAADELSRRSDGLGAGAASAARREADRCAEAARRCEELGDQIIAPATSPAAQVTLYRSMRAQLDEVKGLKDAAKGYAVAVAVEVAQRAAEDARGAARRPFLEEIADIRARLGSDAPAASVRLLGLAEQDAANVKKEGAEAARHAQLADAGSDRVDQRFRSCVHARKAAANAQRSYRSCQRKLEKLRQHADSLARHEERKRERQRKQEEYMRKLQAYEAALREVPEVTAAPPTDAAGASSGPPKAPVLERERQDPLSPAAVGLIEETMPHQGGKMCCRAPLSADADITVQRRYAQQTLSNFAQSQPRYRFIKPPQDVDFGQTHVSGAPVSGYVRTCPCCWCCGVNMCKCAGEC